jgi:hypothetical protein
VVENVGVDAEVRSTALESGGELLYIANHMHDIMCMSRC